MPSYSSTSMGSLRIHRSFSCTVCAQWLYLEMRYRSFRWFTVQKSSLFSSSRAEGKMPRRSKGDTTESFAAPKGGTPPPNAVPPGPPIGAPLSRVGGAANAPGAAGGAPSLNVNGANRPGGAPCLPGTGGLPIAEDGGAFAPSRLPENSPRDAFELVRRLSSSPISDAAGDGVRLPRL
jgi:hypothetical protein